MNDMLLSDRAFFCMLGAAMVILSSYSLYDLFKNRWT